MKIAVLLTGNVRTFNECKSNILSEFSSLKPDYFISTYDTAFQYHPCVKGSLNFNEEYVLPDSEIYNLFNEFSPKRIIIDKESEMNDYFQNERYNFSGGMLGCDPSHFLQFYKIKRGLDQILEYETLLGIEYDIIIRSRLDLIIKNISTINLDNLEDSIIVGYNNPESTQSVLNDQLFLSTQKNMIVVVDSILAEFYHQSHVLSATAFPHGVFQAGIELNNLNVKKESIAEALVRVNNRYDKVA